MLNLGKRGNVDRKSNKKLRSGRGYSQKKVMPLSQNDPYDAELFCYIFFMSVFANIISFLWNKYTICRHLLQIG